MKNSIQTGNMAHRRHEHCLSIIEESDENEPADRNKWIDLALLILIVIMMGLIIYIIMGTDFLHHLYRHL